MDNEARLSQPFLAALEPAQREKVPDPVALEQTLAAALASARAAWPMVTRPDERFFAHLARALPAGLDPTQALSQVHVDDLFVAWACVEGDPAAIAAFESQIFSIADLALRQMRLSAAVVDEIKQVLREQLFVAPAGDRPLIATYSGLGHLRNWLRVVTVRTATRWIGRTGREVPVPDEALEGRVLPAQDSELQHLKEGYHAEFKSAFLQALASLTTQERALLKHHFLDDLNIDQIGALYRVHRATAARWLASAREVLLERTREQLMNQLHLDREGYESIMRLIESRMGFTFRSLLVEDASTTPD
jgi:RNA polymerase sigma-70 factor, ECF subfamily